ncbi:MAG: phosphate ABC transporter substrate-binding protein [Calditrichia bacterium]
MIFMKLKSIACRILLTALILSGLFLTCQPRQHPSPNRLRIKGSDTMLILLRRLAQVYMSEHPGTAVYVEGGGTGAGVKALLDGDADIAAASRPLLPQELSRMAERYQSVGYSLLVAKDALSIYLHPANPVQDLALKQLKQIFTGEYSNWKQLNGKDQKISVYIRPPNSGTYFYFREHILQGEDYLDSATTLTTTRAIVKAVLKDTAGIGYGGTAYGSKVVHSKVNGISPSALNVRYDLYPISRYLYFYTRSKPEGLLQDFFDWVLSTEGQRIVQQIGYIPLRPLENQ